AMVTNQGYRGYGKYRLGGALPTDHRYTGQKLDIDTGLMYYGARYYDRHIGAFVSPDTLMPDPTNVWDYNRFGYARLNPMKYNDPTGHCSSVAAGSPVMLADMGFCSGGSPSGKSGGGGGAVVLVAGGMTAVAVGYLIGQAAHDLVQDVGGYITPDTGPAGSTVHADPLPVSSSASTSFPLVDGGPETSIPASTGVFNDTLNVLADPLPGVDPRGHIVYNEVGLAKQLHGLRESGHAQSNTTTAVISAYDENGNLVYFVANNYGLSPQQVQAIQAMPNAIIVPTPSGNRQHPEKLILQYVGMNHPNYKLHSAGASWTICPSCTQALEQSGVNVLNPR
ncbi:MAG: hypothetical protein DCC55_40030, partial [Chloroflexi bacterium]